MRGREGHQPKRKRLQTKWFAKQYYFLFLNMNFYLVFANMYKRICAVIVYYAIEKDALKTISFVFTCKRKQLVSTSFFVIFSSEQSVNFWKNRKECAVLAPFFYIN